jgi:TetR/AcrR family transcriptional regulator
MTKIPKSRDAVSSKEAILEASTQLFAQKGFEATTIGMIAETAGVARGTPSYFFGSKEKLFQAVLERESQSAKLVIPASFEQLQGNLEPQVLISVLVDFYLDFLASHPRYLRLLQWTALERPQLMQDVQSHWQTMIQANQAVSMIWSTASNPEDIKHLTLSVIGMCSFHFFFGDVIAPHLDINPHDETFLQARKDHLKLFLTAALRGMKEFYGSH